MNSREVQCIFLFLKKQSHLGNLTGRVVKNEKQYFHLSVHVQEVNGYVFYMDGCSLVNVLNAIANGSNHEFYAIYTHMFYVCI